MVVETLEQVRAAIAVEDWPRALAAALEAWRIERTSDLADLIDRITDRCELPQPPQTRGVLHRWWVTRARDADPVMIGALLAKFALRQYSCDEPLEAMRARWPDSAVMESAAALRPPNYLVEWARRRGETYTLPIPNWVERVAAICTWPDDPRITRVLGGLVIDNNATIHAEGGEGPWPAIVERLRTLRDGRLDALINRNGNLPRYAGPRQRAFQALQKEAVTTTAASGVSELLPDREAAGIPLASLWQEVAERPEDDAPRLVLADALLAAGDNRGELIALQCTPDPENRNRAEVQANRLISHEWERWMGDLALVLVRRGTVMRRGMLDAVRVGQAATPLWAWDAIAGHRELAVVREVRPAQVDPFTFAKLIAGLPRFPRMLQIDAHEVIEKLLATHENQAVEEIFYAPINNQVSYRRTRPLFQDTFRMLARLAPNLERLDLGSLWWVGGVFGAGNLQAPPFVELLELIQSLFPRLSRIRIEQQAVRQEARTVVAEIPKVELVTTKLGF